MYVAFISGTDIADHLQKLKTRIMPIFRCKREWPDNVFANKNICAGGEQGKSTMLAIQSFINLKKY